MNRGGALDSIFGGWTLGTILVMQSGTPAIIGGGVTATTGGFNTLNNNDSGVVFNNGSTAAQLQSSIGIYRSGNPWVTVIDPKLIGANGGANYRYVSPNNTAGAFGYRPYIYGPHWFNDDFSLNKSVPIRENIRLTFQAEFLNLFNHPTFNLGNFFVQSTSFTQATTGPTGPRNIEFRANIVF